jgi:hypothetical protein
LQAVLLGCYKRLRALNGPVRVMSRLIAAGTTAAQDSRTAATWRASPPSPMANFDACPASIARRCRIVLILVISPLARLSRLRSCNGPLTRRAKLLLVLNRKPLDPFRKIGFVLPAYATKDCCSSSFYQKDRGPLGLAARRRDARIGPACAVRAARVGPPLRIVQVLVTALPPRRRWIRCVYPEELH